MSRNEVSMNILTEIIYPLDFETLGQNIPNRCVLTLDRNQVVHKNTTATRFTWVSQAALRGTLFRDVWLRG